MVGEREVIELVQGLTVRRLRVWVKRGWVMPAQESRQGSVFNEIDVARIHLITQLKTDMALNDEAIPVVLSLIDQVHGLRYELKSLARAVEAQQEGVQRKILRACNLEIGKSL